MIIESTRMTEVTFVN